MNGNAYVEILLVEDNPGDVELTLMAFEESSLMTKLNVVTDGQSALDYVFNEGDYTDNARPDLILLDINLPGISGLEVLEKIKSDARYAMIPVIILTTSSMDRDIVKAYSAHANAYLNKPVDYDSFLEMVQSIERFWFKLVKKPY